jgi:hypothetical protein
MKDMSHFFRKDYLVPICAGSFMLITLWLFVWAMQTILADVALSLQPPTGATVTVKYDIEGASKIDFRGSLKQK